MMLVRWSRACRESLLSEGLLDLRPVDDHYHQAPGYKSAVYPRGGKKSWNFYTTTFDRMDLTII